MPPFGHRQGERGFAFFTGTRHLMEHHLWVMIAGHSQAWRHARGDRHICTAAGALAPTWEPSEAHRWQTQTDSASGAAQAGRQSGHCRKRRASAWELCT